MKKIFVTGGTGRIGHRLTGELVKNGWKVVVLTRSVDVRKRAGVEYLAGDVEDGDLLRRYLEGVELVIHLAAYQNPNDGSYRRFREVNVEGARNVLEAVDRVSIKRILYVSSAAVFRDTGEIPRGELWPLIESGDNYAMSKKEGLDVARSYYGRLPIVTVFPTLVLDLSGNYAPNVWWQKWLWRWFGGGVPGGLATLIGDQERMINVVFMNDAVEGMIRVLLRGVVGEEYILGGKNFTVKDYRKLMSVKTGCMAECLSFLTRRWVKRSVCLSSAKAIKNIGYEYHTFKK